MLGSKLILLLGQLIWVALAERHLFTSTSHIAQLSTAKQQLAEALLGFVDNETLRLHRIRQFAETLENSTMKNAADAAAAAETAMHPVQAFLTIRRMGQEWKKLLGDCGDFTDSVLKSVGVELPTSSDYEGAADALLRLQDVYGISADSMARGRLTGGISGEEDVSADHVLLSADDCLHLVFRAFNRSLEPIGMQWIRLLMSDVFSVEERSEKRPAVWDIVQKFIIEKSKHRMGEQIETMWYYSRGNATDCQNHYKIMAQYEQYLVDQDNYKKLCKDGSFSRPNVSSTGLKCRLSVPHPFFTLAPVKEELLNEDPKVLFLYDVLTDAVSRRLVQVAVPKLQRAKVADGRNSQYRISKSAFMLSTEDWSVKQVNDRVSAITGLNVADSDALQMGNYGIGGHYEPHMDSFGSGVSHGNNRVATVLLYLNDVELGGGTVFPRLGLRALPVKNAALFWYNLKRSSIEVADTLHAACPVLKGSKWVANKWIFYLGQVHHRPCALDLDL